MIASHCRADRCGPRPQGHHPRDRPRGRRRRHGQGATRCRARRTRRGPQCARDLIDKIVREAGCPVVVLLHVRDHHFIKEASKRSVRAQSATPTSMPGRDRSTSCYGASPSTATFRARSGAARCERTDPDRGMARRPWRTHRSRGVRADALRRGRAADERALAAAPPARAQRCEHLRGRSRLTGRGGRGASPCDA
jgi:hypothetical protein